MVAVLRVIGSQRARESTAEQSLGCSEDGVTTANAKGEGSFGWRHWTRWTSVGDLYVLQDGRRAFTFVPRRAFAAPAAASEFRELLARHIGTR